MTDLATPPAPARPAAAVAATAGQAHPTVIVFGNEKGGSGKSTCAMHVIAGLLRDGRRVGSLDLDNRQWTLSHYIANRAKTATRETLALPMPEHAAITASDLPDRAEAEAADRATFETEIAKLHGQVDIIVVDCAGTDTFLGRLAVSHADKLVTPINDSFVDLDLLASVDPANVSVERPGVYAAMVWDQRKVRAKRDRRSIDWIVMRNRLSSINARNKMEIARVLEELSGRVGFRIAPGFSERVIYRELFLRGLTMLDMFVLATSGTPQMSHLAARQEVRDLLAALELPGPPNPA